MKKKRKFTKPSALISAEARRWIQHIRIDEELDKLFKTKRK